jgi:hypothetical protein
MNLKGATKLKEILSLMGMIIRLQVTTSIEIGERTTVHSY